MILFVAANKRQPYFHSLAEVVGERHSWEVFLSRSDTNALN